MQIIETIQDFKKAMRSAKAQGHRIGFIPTMGYLHEGHLSLVRRSVSENDVTVVSTFVNPAQFGPNMDFGRYPRDEQRDRHMLEQEAVDYIFHPSVEDIYPPEYNTWVEVEHLTSLLDGASRPGYFRGICTVVLKLFNIVACDATYFGQKDIQQAVTIRKMIADLNLGIDLVIMPIIREADGLAMSSRNAYLKGIDRKTASLLYQGLATAEQLFHSGEIDASVLTAAVRRVVSVGSGIVVDYIDVVGIATMQRVEQVEVESCIAIAVNLNGTRLIDNVILKPAS